MNEMSAESWTHIDEIASRIVDLREISDITPEEMAEKLNIPLEKYLSYERAEVDFPVSVLYEICSYLKVDLTEILTGTSPKLAKVSLVRKGQGISVDRYKGYDFESIAYKFAGRKIEPMIVTVGAETETNVPQLVAHNGQEFNYVLEGKLTVYVGKNKFELDEGDCLYFDPTDPHAQAARGGKEAKFLTVILL